MKIVTWNCNGALRKKLEYLSVFDADIYVIQECEDPALSISKEYKAWAINHLWTGDNKNKGLGIFAKEHINLELLPWSDHHHEVKVRYFLPCLVNGDFQLLAVWAHQNNSPTFGYIGQFWKYLQANKDHFGKIVLAGDFNSNAIWDKWDRWWNHSDVVQEIGEMGITSLYHHFHQEEQGKESIPTFYLHRNRAKPYHIDYIFAHEYLSAKLSQLEVGSVDEWLALSDHLPICASFIPTLPSATP